MKCSLNVLFVDNSEEALQGLARLLAACGLPWTARFAQSGGQALSSLSLQPCDVLVADVNLPDMSGVELLERVRESNPLTLRILLAPYSGGGTVSGLLKSAHQLLSKPCPAVQLLDAVQTSCRLRDLYMNEAVRAAVHQLGHLPVLPKIYNDLRHELAKDDFSVRTLGNIISQDLGLTAGILKIVNSAYFGLVRRVDSPHQAVALLGAGMLKGLVIYEQVFKMLDPAKYSDLNIERLWSHSLDAARCCRMLARVVGQDSGETEDAFLAGLLHDLGKIVLHEGAPDGYRRALHLAASESISLVEAEASVFGATHAEIGAYVLGLWGFDAQVVQPIAAHHRPSLHGTVDPVTAILHCTDVLLHDMSRRQNGQAIPDLDQAYLDICGLGDQEPIWRQMIADELLQPA